MEKSGLSLWMICIKNSILRKSLKKHHKEAEHMMIVIPPKQDLGFIKPEEYKKSPHQYKRMPA